MNILAPRYDGSLDLTERFCGSRITKRPDALWNSFELGSLAASEAASKAAADPLRRDFLALSSPTLFELLPLPLSLAWLLVTYSPAPGMAGAPELRVEGHMIEAAKVQKGLAAALRKGSSRLAACGWSLTAT